MSPPMQRAGAALARLPPAAVAALVAFFLAAPAFIVVPMSFSGSSLLVFPPPSYSLRWYENYLGVPEWRNATLYSVEIACWTTLAALVLGTAAAFGIVRGRVPAPRATIGLIMLPLLVPGILTAFAEYRLLGALGLIGDTAGIVFAHTILATPFVVVVVVSALRRLDPALERAAMSLGAGPVRTFLRVTLPMLRPSILTAALLAFLTSFNEFIVTLFVIGSARSTLPIQLWKGIRFETNPTIAAASTLFIALTMTILLAVLAATALRGEASPPKRGGV
jgi:putative spermidine/putrescine transport system permease protein